MNGAIADPLVNTINTPNNNKIIISGINQYFFLVLRNAHKSFKNSMTFIFN